MVLCYKVSNPTKKNLDLLADTISYVYSECQ